MIAETTTATLNEAATQFAQDVRAGLNHRHQKQLPSKYLYDPIGSALFEAITVMPEYGLTRADERLIRRHAAEIVEVSDRPSLIAELGSGSGKKTRYLLEAFSAAQDVSYYPIEISAAALASCERELGSLPLVKIRGIELEYLAGLRSVSARRQVGERLIVLFLGSTIGNFDGGADRRFLSEVRNILKPGDSLLLGADLVKPAKQLLLAYDDPAGITAAFNLNLLGRINRELEGNFDLRRFEHVARVNENTSSVEMHLLSKEAQTVAIDRAEMMVRFAKGETIWTESSHKYSVPELSALASATGFSLERQWIDSEWHFSENLLVAA